MTYRAVLSVSIEELKQIISDRQLEVRQDEQFNIRIFNPNGNRGNFRIEGRWNNGERRECPAENQGPAGHSGTNGKREERGDKDSKGSNVEENKRVDKADKG